VTQPNPDSRSGPSPRDFWKETFGVFGKGKASEEKADAIVERERAAHAKGKGEEEEEGKARPAKKLEGLGDEAYWDGSRVGGTLYVLKGDVFLRISVGGSDDEEARLRKSKALAEKAFAHL
jgi:hypothetical protein